MDYDHYGEVAALLEAPGPLSAFEQVIAAHQDHDAGGWEATRVDGAPAGVEASDDKIVQRPQGAVGPRSGKEFAEPDSDGAVPPDGGKTPDVLGWLRGQVPDGEAQGLARTTARNDVAPGWDTIEDLVPPGNIVPVEMTSESPGKQRDGGDGFFWDNAPWRHEAGAAPGGPLVSSIDPTEGHEGADDENLLRSELLAGNADISGQLHGTEKLGTEFLVPQSAGLAANQAERQLWVAEQGPRYPLPDYGEGASNRVDGGMSLPVVAGILHEDPADVNESLPADTAWEGYSKAQEGRGFKAGGSEKLSAVTDAFFDQDGAESAAEQESGFPESDAIPMAGGRDAFEAGTSALMTGPGVAPAVSARMGDEQKEAASAPGWLVALTGAVVMELSNTLFQEQHDRRNDTVDARRGAAGPSGSRADPLHVKLVDQAASYHSRMLSAPTGNLAAQSMPLPGQVVFSP